MLLSTKPFRLLSLWVRSQKQSCQIDCRVVHCETRLAIKMAFLFFFSILIAILFSSISSFFTPEQSNKKKLYQADRKTIAFQIELPAEYVQFLNLTSVSPHVSHEKKKRIRKREGGEKQREREGKGEERRRKKKKEKPDRSSKKEGPSFWICVFCLSLADWVLHHSAKIPICRT